MTGNTIMLKIKYIILLGRLQQAAINVDYNIFFFSQDAEESTSISHKLCSCAIFTKNPKKIEPIQSQKLSRIWEIVAGDLFRSAPVSNHVIVV